MRLHCLELTAFGPYALPQRIDFDRLTSGGLFLLEGPTGAGKSTILDAITFALYGGLAGEDSADDRLHSDFADPDAEPSVTLEFSLRAVRYLITRVPEHQRLKRRGSGYTTEPMRVHLQRRERGTWMSLSSNKAETGDLITEIVGLSRTQFTQVMLLPQGEFARFLRSDDDARRVVLTKLFGTELYDRITGELDRRRADAVRARHAAEAEIAKAASAAAEAAGLDAGARGELLLLPASEGAARLSQISAEQAATFALAVQALALATSQVASAQRDADTAAKQAGLMTRLTEALARAQEHEASEPEHRERVARLQAARRAEPVRPLLAALAEAQDEAAAARGELPAGAAPGSARLARQAGRQAAAGAEAGLREATGLDYLVDAESAAAGRESALCELESAAVRAAAEVESLTAVRQVMPDRIAACEVSVSEARDAAAGLAAARQRLAALVPVGEAARRLAELEPVLAVQAAALRAAVDEHQRLVDAHQRAMDGRLAGMAGELAAGLADGAACPVCGSAEHPVPAAADLAVVTGEAVETARRHRDTAQVSRRRAEHEHAELDKEAARCAAVAAGSTLAAIAQETAVVTGQLAAAELAAAQLASRESDLAELRAEQEMLGEHLLQATAAQTASVEQARRARADLAVLRAELAGAAGEYPSVAARQRAVREAADADGALAGALERLAAALTAGEQARTRAEAEALASGFADLDAARSAVLAAADHSALDDRVRDWETSLAAFRSAAGAPELADLDPARSDEVHELARRTAAELVLARSAELRAAAARDAQQLMARRLRQRLAEVRAAQQAAETLAAATGPVIYLAGLARGMEGHRRVALTTYVLRQWFEQVVAAANVRLAVMSFGRYELRRIDEGEFRRQRTGLTLSVVDRHTGQERSPKSLSGGETFYTSLALALGLADVVKAEAGGVDTETLFIDEGFGSLDSQTLDQVLGVIDELRDRGRAVGIVSHVTDLKERIPERLEVRRLPDGSSTVTVVA